MTSEHPLKADWPNGQIPAQVTADDSKQTIGYPALTPETGGIGVHVFLNQVQAHYTHRAGLAALFRIAQADQVQYVQKRLPLNPILQLTLNAIDEYFWMI